MKSRLKSKSPCSENALAIPTIQVLRFPSFFFFFSFIPYIKKWFSRPILKNWKLSIIFWNKILFANLNMKNTFFNLFSINIYACCPHSSLLLLTRPLPNEVSVCFEQVVWIEIRGPSNRCINSKHSLTLNICKQEYKRWDTTSLILVECNNNYQQCRSYYPTIEPTI